MTEHYINPDSDIDSDHTSDSNSDADFDPNRNRSAEDDLQKKRSKHRRAPFTITDVGGHAFSAGADLTASYEEETEHQPEGWYAIHVYPNHGMLALPMHFNQVKNVWIITHPDNSTSVVRRQRRASTAELVEHVRARRDVTAQYGKCLSPN